MGNPVVYFFLPDAPSASPALCTTLVRKSYWVWTSSLRHLERGVDDLLPPGRVLAMRWQRLIDGHHELAHCLDRALLAALDLLEHLFGQLGGSLDPGVVGRRGVFGLFGCGGHFCLLIVCRTPHSGQGT